MGVSRDMVGAIAPGRVGRTRCGTLFCKCTMVCAGGGGVLTVWYLAYAVVPPGFTLAPG